MLSGLRAWVFQRISALYLALYSVFIFLLLIGENTDYSRWITLKENSLFIVSTLVAGLFLFIHCWVGIRDIILDYARGSVMRLVFLSLLMVVLVLEFVWFVLIFMS